MVYESDLTNLLSMWKGRLEDTNRQDYHDAINDCIFDVNWLLENKHKEEAAIRQIDDDRFASMSIEELQELMEEQEADNYLSSMEFQEKYY